MDSTLMPLCNYSIIISNYNTGELLAGLLESIPQRDDIQVIVVDDCSTSDLALLDALKDRYRGYEWYSTSSNGGGGKARNEGLRHAKGKWVIFADSDDRFSASFNEILDDYVSENYDVVCFNACILDENGRVSPKSSMVPEVIDEVCRSSGADDRIRFRLVQTWAKLYSGELIRSRSINFEESRICNDVRFSTLCDYYAESFRVDGRELYVHVKRPGSVISGRSKDLLLERLRIVCRRDEYIRSHGYGSVDDDAYVGRALRLLFEHVGRDTGLREIAGVARECAYGSGKVRMHYIRYKTRPLKAKLSNMKIKIGKIFLLSLIMLAGCSGNPAVDVQDDGHVRLVKVGEGYARTSVNTSVFRQSSLVSDGRNQYISFYDKNGRVIIGKRAMGDGFWELTKTPYKGKVSDAHRGISLGLDGDGVLHVAFDHHLSPLNYFCMNAAGDIPLIEEKTMTGLNEEKVTYPEFYPMPDGGLLFAYRSGASGNGNMVLNRYSSGNREWRQLHENLIDGENERNAYWQIFVDRSGIIHLSWVWRETGAVETNHDLCYARSTDGGITWERSDGTLYDLPITMETAEVAWPVSQNTDLINQTSMTADMEGHPYIASYWRGETDDVPQYRLVWHDGSDWKMSCVGRRESPFTISGRGTKMIPISRPRVVSDGKKTYFFFRDEERGSVVSMAVSDDPGSGAWEITDLTDFSVDAWEPLMDMDLWNREGKINLFVQRTHQGDGERLSKNRETKTPVYVLEVQ